MHSPAIVSTCVGLARPGLHGSAKILHAVGDRILWADWNANKTYDANAADRRAWLATLLAPVGHPPTAITLPLLLAIFVIFGPGLGSRPSSDALIAVLIAFVGLVGARALNKNERALLLIEIGVLLALTLWIWFCAEPHARAWQDGLYRHAMIPMIWAFLAVILVAKLFGRLLFLRFDRKFAALLDHTKFSDHAHSKPNSQLFYWNLWTVLISEPILLLYFPAWVVICVPERIAIFEFFSSFWTISWLLIILSVIVSSLFIAAADTYAPFDHARDMLKRTLLIGGQLLVSLAILLLAAARLLDVQYVTNVLESVPSLLAIVLYAVAAYAIFWFYGYWTGRILCEEVLNTFRSGNDRGSAGRIRYSAELGQNDQQSGEGASSADAIGSRPEGDSAAIVRGRYLQIHGASRFAIVEPTAEGKELWTGPKYDLDEFIDRVIRRLDPRLSHEVKELALVMHRIRIHRIVSNGVLALAFACAALYFHQLPQSAELSVVTSNAQMKAGLIDLQDRIMAADHDPGLASDPATSGKDRDPRPVILLAASGGGTRAALFTESVLRGLADRGLLDQLVLASGVSGGSLALAYFAANRKELLDGSDPAAWKCAWGRFSAAMAQPFIQDTLQGVSEWRVIASQSTDYGWMGLRTGDLLAESFERHFEGASDLAVPDGCDSTTDRRVATLGDAAFAVIFNTSVVGCFPYWECRGEKAPDLPQRLEACLDAATPVAVRERDCRQLETSELAGSRLILTNLKDASGFPVGAGIAEPDEYLNYLVVQDPSIPLARAAALSANFPPVFSNAAVDIDDRVRYWVTDGGATDNRGIISLLYALEAALDDFDESTQEAWPEVHVMVAEASAADLAFHQDRGLGAKFGAPEKFASQLMIELKRRIEDKLGDKFHLHYLSMPAVLRSNGGFGTHWMLPSSMRFHAPLSEQFADEALRQVLVTLDGEAVRRIIDSLHVTADSTLNPGPVDGANREQAEVLQHWIANDHYRNHPKVWTCAVAALMGPGAEAGRRCRRGEGEALVGMAD